MRTNKLHIYTGCMASGKSNELLRWYKFSPLNFDLYTFGKDGFISSRNVYYKKTEAISIESPNQIGVGGNRKNNLILDECQFFNEWKLSDIELLHDKYQKIYLAGLDWLDMNATFMRTQFYECLIVGGYQLPFGYVHTQLVAKNDLTGVNDARISMRFCDVTDIIDKSNYFNVSYSEAFDRGNKAHSLRKSDFVRAYERKDL